MAGYSYVTFVTERRANLCIDRWQTLSNFRKVALFALTVWWVGPVFTLSEGMCNPSLSSIAGVYRDATYEDRVLFGVMVRLLVCFAIPFALGLQWTHLDSFPLLNAIVCTGAAMKALPITSWVILILFTLLIVGVVAGNLFFLFTQSESHWLGVLLGYVALILLVAIMLLYFVRLRKTHHPHLHHYQIFAVLVPLCSARGSLLGVASQAVCLGVAIEGASRWTLAPFIEHNDLTKHQAKKERGKVMKSLLNPPDEPSTSAAAPTPGATATPARTGAPKSGAAKVVPEHADGTGEEVAVYHIKADSPTITIPAWGLVSLCTGPEVVMRRGSLPSWCLVNCCYDNDGALCCVGSVTDGCLQPDLNRVKVQ